MKWKPARLFLFTCSLSVQSTLCLRLYLKHDIKTIELKRRKRKVIMKKDDAVNDLIRSGRPWAIIYLIWPIHIFNCFHQNGSYMDKSHFNVELWVKGHMATLREVRIEFSTDLQHIYF